MAQKLHDVYGFDYNYLKVLLGGWNNWKDNNAKDPNAYPIETAPGVTPATGTNGQIKVTSGGVVLTPGTAPPAPNTIQPTSKP